MLATQLERHGDNAAPALFGGLQVVVAEDDMGVHVGIEPPSDVQVALLIPECSMHTDAEREKTEHEAQKDREAELALQEAARLRDRRHRIEAREAVRGVERLLSDGSREHHREQLNAIVADLDMVDRLEEIRLQPYVSGWSIEHRRAAYQAYADAFRGYGIDVETLGRSEAARRVRAAPIREELICALDDWAGGHYDEEFDPGSQEAAGYGSSDEGARVDADAMKAFSPNWSRRVSTTSPRTTESGRRCIQPGRRGRVPELAPTQRYWGSSRTECWRSPRSRSLRPLSALRWASARGEGRLWGALRGLSGIPLMSC